MTNQTMTTSNTTKIEPMSYHLSRLSTFRNFPSSTSSIRLAENGFYYTGLGDEVQCFSCGVYYSNWTCTDIPKEVHSRISPTCRMVNGQESKNKKGVCPDIYHLLHSRKASREIKQISDVVERYPMRQFSRGIAVIINNKYFNKDPCDPFSVPLENRAGTEKDAERLSQLWTRLQFKVNIFNNLKKEDILNIANTISGSDHSGFDCLVFCILTHGGYGFLYGVDGRIVETLNIIELFQGSQCPTLVGKPKMFFIQACQGNSCQTALLWCNVVDCSIKNNGVEMLRFDGMPMAFNGREISKTDTIPNEADFLLSFSTVPGCVSYRCPTNGTWYINSLCEQIGAYADSDLERGDQLAVEGEENGIEYYHHGIFLGHKEGIADFGGANKADASIRKVDLLAFTNYGKRRLVRIKYPKGHCLPPEVAAQNAEKLLENPDHWGKYDLIHNNCEHFATKCKTGIAVSFQVIKNT